MLEVYAGARPGRPVFLTVICAALLAGSLGLAWVQVRESRALAPERPIAGTPLAARVPRDWKPHPRVPGMFVLGVKRRESWGGVRLEIERSIRFEFGRVAGQRSPAQLLRALGIDPQSAIGPLPCRIGEFDAFEVRVPARLGADESVREQAIRIAQLADGYYIRVEYTPLVDMTPGDMELLDDVCRTVRLSDERFQTEPAELSRRAGIQLVPPDGARFAALELEEVPGFFLYGQSSGAPWSLSVLRTWLADGRRPADLLADFAAEKWLDRDAAARVQTSRRGDGATVASLRHAEFGRVATDACAVLLLQQSPTECALVLVHAGPAESQRAAEIAGRVIESIRLAPLAPLKDVAAAESVGRELAGKLSQRGATPRWGREPVDLEYVSLNAAVARRRSVSRRAIGRNADGGYRGESEVRQAGVGRLEYASWQIDGRAASFEYQCERLVRPLLGAEPIRALSRETRAREGDEIVRQIILEDGRRDSLKFAADAGYVCPPVEPLIAGWVARGEAEAVLVRASTPLGAGSHTLLFIRLPRANDRWRALALRDYDPRGVRLTFDPSMEVAVEETPDERFELARR